MCACECSTPSSSITLLRMRSGIRSTSCHPAVRNMATNTASTHRMGIPSRTMLLAVSMTRRVGRSLLFVKYSSSV